MNYLTQIKLDLKQMYDLNLISNYAWHQKLWDCFPYNKERDFLTRVDLEDFSAKSLILSEQKPIRPKWCFEGSFITKEISPSFLSHDRYFFNLKANPTKKIRQKNENNEWVKSKRIPILKEEGLCDWLKRKSLMGGFIISVEKKLEVGPANKIYFKGKENYICNSGVVFKGLISITNSELFKQTYKQGVGSAKGFGFGLLLLAPHTN